MSSLISSGILITVETAYQADVSEPLRQHFVFAYRITIENKNDFPVRLMRRYWNIIDSNGERKQVEGDGVVGVQPTILPGEHYQYVSACHLQSDIGMMTGQYQMMNVNTRQTFRCTIPAFVMQSTERMN